MSRKHFGTDGIRGIANELLTPELAFSLGQAAGRFMLARKWSPRAILGRDTRRSGPMLGAAMAAGLNSVGIDVDDQGIVPTPSITFAAREFDYGLGVIISASHNPAPDNGIKLIGHDGKKLADADEVAIEELMDSPIVARPTAEQVGLLRFDRSGVEAYLNFLESLLPEGLAGMRIAVDAAHGAAFELAPEILVRLGAEVVLMGAEPDGMNINSESGATRPEAIQEFTVASGCAIGVAFDGDADRAVFSDEKGGLINGDQMMAIWAAHWQGAGKLSPPTVVGTVMSNGGFERYMDSLGIKLERAAVGDKYVSQRIAETGARIGGEQSGHIIFPANGPTGDGLATALELLRVLRREGKSAAELGGAFDPLPQLLVNVEVGSKDGWAERPAIQSALEEAEARLQGNGRLSVRPSGTQPMIRVMVEATEFAERDEIADRVVGALLDELGGRIYSRVDLTHALGD